MQQPGTPYVIEVFKQPDAARDISVDTVLGIFALAGVFLVACLVVALLGAGSFLLYRRLREEWGGPIPRRDAALDLTRPDDPDR